MTSHEETAQIKGILQRAWVPFFSRHGRLFPAQIAAIPKALQGANLVIASPTASGKTEAIVAPIAQWISGHNISGLKALYISPTRALVNDLEVRLKEPLLEMGISLTVKTGDRPQFNPRQPADFLLTTPEATDSLLCRYPEVFETLQFVVLDELHLMDGMYRGDQLRLLLNRIRRLSPKSLRCHALSATMADPTVMASRYFADPCPIIVQGQRELDSVIMHSLPEAVNHTRATGMVTVQVPSVFAFSLPPRYTVAGKYWLTNGRARAAALYQRGGFSQNDEMGHAHQRRHCRRPQPEAARRRRRCHIGR